MACCLTAPSHYLSHCWLIIGKVQWHWSEGILYLVWHLNTSSRRMSLSKSESPASHPSVTCLFQCGAIESPASRRKMRVLREAVLARGDRQSLYDKLAISNTYSHAKNRNDLRPITLSKVPFPEVGFSAVAILGGGWLQSPASDGPPWLYYTPRNEVRGGILDSACLSVCPSVCLSVRLSVC